MPPTSDGRRVRARPRRSWVQKDETHGAEAARLVSIGAHAEAATEDEKHRVEEGDKKPMPDSEEMLGLADIHAENLWQKLVSSMQTDV